MFDPQSSDEELVGLAKESPAAFTALVRRHTQSVYRVAIRLSANPSDAEEILQETFLQVHRRLDSFRGESRFSTWLHRVAVNTALMHLRDRRRHEAERLDDYLPAFDDTGKLVRLDVDYSRVARADEIVERRQLATAALEAIGKLPDIYRIPFVLRDLEGMEPAEITALLGIDASLLRQRVHRARLMVRCRLAGLVGGE